MKLNFVGGSQDGSEIEIPMEMKASPVLLCEQYEYMSDGRYHFIGYVS